MLTLLNTDEKWWFQLWKIFFWWMQWAKLWCKTWIGRHLDVVSTRFISIVIYFNFRVSIKRYPLTFGLANYALAKVHLFDLSCVKCMLLMLNILARRNWQQLGWSLNWTILTVFQRFGGLVWFGLGLSFITGLRSVWDCSNWLSPNQWPSHLRRKKAWLN